MGKFDVFLHHLFSWMNYLGKGLPCSSQLAQPLILQHLQNGARASKELVNYVGSVHLENGGLHSSFPTQVKKALQDLQLQGLISAKRGHWELSPSMQVDCSSGSSSSKPPKGPEGSVYLYFFQSYQALAYVRGHVHWPCKIGFTQGDVEHRVKQQIGTGHPERPIVALQRHVPSIECEKAVHAILRAWGRHVTNAGGEEWFTTNPGEVQGLLQIVAP